MPNPDPNQEYADALLAEVAAWEAVRSCLPGSGRFDAACWQAWRQAQRRTELARAAVISQTSTVKLSSPEVTRPGFYLYWGPDAPDAIRVRVLRTPSVAIVRFPAPTGDVPLANLPGTFVGPVRR